MKLIEVDSAYRTTAEWLCPWQYALRDSETLYVAHGAPHTVVPLMASGGFNSAVCWSPDGQYLYATGAKGQFVRLALDRNARMMRLDEVTNPSTSTSKFVFPFRMWADREQSILYCLMFSHARTEGDPPFELWKMDEDTLSAIRALPMGFCSPDVDINTARGVLVECHATDSGGMVDVFSLSGHSISQWQLPELVPRWPSISPSAALCVFNLIEDGNHKLILMDLGTGQLRQLTDATFAAWSPDGSYLAAVREDSELLVIDLKAMRVHRIAWSPPPIDSTETRDPHGWHSIRPEWTPDGKYLTCVLARWTRSAVAQAKLITRDGSLPLFWRGEPVSFVVDFTRRLVCYIPVWVQRFAWRPNGTAEKCHERMALE